MAPRSKKRSYSHTFRHPDGLLQDIAQFVQDSKIQISIGEITALQHQGRWPEEYKSYVKKEQPSNEFKDPAKFFRIMHYKPKLFLKKFLYRSERDLSRNIRLATYWAFELILRQASKYGKQSGFYGASFVIAKDGVPIVSRAELRDITPETRMTIYNTAPYAGTVEKNALYFAAIGGVIYYAASQVKKRHPELGISFGFPRAESVNGAYSKYNVPTLTIGQKSRVRGRLKTPGKNYRRRERKAQSNG